ncbi:MAG: hypothetical protein CTY38_00915 [Methylotenera sp.]|uniref:imm11 family protein n=1 Tax=Methylotenera sp. TaxID=2051956 RepID=UPI000D3F910E|nr:hypothetical protein [Methylotenera sp.]PPC84639.1 MAG: hypothetical protein CTY38_00915 [Methylotenera sp.]
MKIYITSPLSDDNGNFIHRDAVITNFDDVLARTKGRPTQALFEEKHIPYVFRWIDDHPISDFVPCDTGEFLMTGRAKEALNDLLTPFGAFYDCTIDGDPYFNYISWNVIEPYDLSQPLENAKGIVKHRFNELAKSQHFFRVKRYPVQFVSQAVKDCYEANNLTGLRFRLVGE